MKIHNVGQGSYEWHQLRSQMISATGTNCLLVQPKTGTWGDGAITFIKKKAKERVLGMVEETITSDAMQWGIDNEETARRRFTELTGVTVDEVGFVEMEKHIGCSPDGFTSDGGLVEIKCPYSQDVFNGYVKKQEAPRNYLVQMLHQLWTTDRPHCVFFAYDPRTDEFFMKCYTVSTICELLSTKKRIITLEYYEERVREALAIVEMCAEVVAEIASTGEITDNAHGMTNNVASCGGYEDIDIWE